MCVCIYIFLGLLNKIQCSIVVIRLIFETCMLLYILIYIPFLVF